MDGLNNIFTACLPGSSLLNNSIIIIPNILFRYRYYPGMCSQSGLRDAQDIDVLYLDNTYCTVPCDFPSRAAATKTIITIIQDHPHHDIKIGIRDLGKEDLLEAIAKELQEWIVVSEKKYAQLKVLGARDVFITDNKGGRIHAVNSCSISAKNMAAWNTQAPPTIAILPTSLYTGLNRNPFSNQEEVFVVCYSDHSSHGELCQFVDEVKPRKIIPIVGPKTRGVFGSDLSSRADMRCFDKYLSTETASTFSIPDSVERHMSGALDNTSACKDFRNFMNQKKAVRRWEVLKRASSKKSKGVAFDSPPKSQGSTKKSKDVAFDSHSPNSQVSPRNLKGADDSPPKSQGSPKTSKGADDSPPKSQESPRKSKGADDSPPKSQGSPKKSKGADDSPPKSQGSPKKSKGADDSPPKSKGSPKKSKGADDSPPKSQESPRKSKGADDSPPKSKESPRKSKGADDSPPKSQESPRKSKGADDSPSKSQDSPRKSKGADDSPPKSQGPYPKTSTVDSQLLSNVESQREIEIIEIHSSPMSLVEDNDLLSNVESHRDREIIEVQPSTTFPVEDKQLHDYVGNSRQTISTGVLTCHASPQSDAVSSDLKVLREGKSRSIMREGKSRSATSNEVTNQAHEQSGSEDGSTERIYVSQNIMKTKGTGLSKLGKRKSSDIFTSTPCQEAKRSRGLQPSRKRHSDLVDTPVDAHVYTHVDAHVSSSTEKAVISTVIRSTNESKDNGGIDSDSNSKVSSSVPLIDTTQKMSISPVNTSAKLPLSTFTEINKISERTASKKTVKRTHGISVMEKRMVKNTSFTKALSVKPIKNSPHAVDSTIIRSTNESKDNGGIDSDSNSKVSFSVPLIDTTQKLSISPVNTSAKLPLSTFTEINKISERTASKKTVKRTHGISVMEKRMVKNTSFTKALSVKPIKNSPHAVDSTIIRSTNESKDNGGIDSDSNSKVSFSVPLIDTTQKLSISPVNTSVKLPLSTFTEITERSASKKTVKRTHGISVMEKRMVKKTRFTKAPSVKPIKNSLHVPSHEGKWKKMVKGPRVKKS